MSPSQEAKVEAELSNEFQFIARSTDSLLQMQAKDHRFMALTEMQFLYDQTMPYRLSAYAALARHKYKQKVFVTVVYFLPPTDEDEEVLEAFHETFMGHKAHQDFLVIKLWELDAEAVLAHDNPALLPFVPLMKGGDQIEVVQRCAARIRQEPEALELETILATFASYVLKSELLNQILRWEMNVIQEAPLMKEFLAEAQLTWFEEGREEGLMQGLNKVLVLRFGMESGLFDQKFAVLSLTDLNHLYEAAMEVQTLAEFKEALTDALIQNEPKRNSPQTNADSL